MNQLIYNPYLLYMNSNGFRIVKLQTNNTLFLTDKTFIKIKEVKFQKAKFLVKKREKLTLNTPIKFNKGYIKQKKDLIAFT
jgi:hypothetical protein